MGRRRAGRQLVVGIALAARAAAGAAEEIQLETIALSGDPVPGGAPGATFTSFSDVLVDESGAVAIVARASDRSGRGVWLHPGRQDDFLAAILRDGDPAPGFPAPSQVAQLLAPASNARGELVLAMERQAVWLRDASGQILLLARSYAEQPPGTPPGTRWTHIADHLLNARGDVAFSGILTGPGISYPTNGRGIWVADASGGLRLEVLAGDPAPVSAPGRALDSFGPPSLNDLGEVAFRATLKSPTPSWTSAILGPGPTGERTVRVAVGDPAPGAGAGAVFTTLSSALGFANDGAIAFTASHTGAASGLWSSPRVGEPLPIALRGEAMPEIGATASLYNLSSSQVSGDGGHVGFGGTVTVGGDPVVRYLRAVWRWHPDSGRQRIALEGSTAPGLPPGTLLGASSMLALNELGDALLSVNAASEEEGGYTALVYAPRGAPLIRLARSGQRLEVRPGDERTLLYLLTDESARGHPLLTRSGDVVFRASFEDGSTGVFVAHLRAADDADGDGVRDLVDVCPVVADPGQEDADADRVGDACNDADDSDGDEVRDDLDNCPATPNDQRDADRDTLGDACDPFPQDADHEWAELRADLAFAQEALGLTLVAIGSTREDIDRTRGEVVQAEDELRECLERRFFADADADGEDDGLDACPGTAPGVEVDAAGCSLEQFCAAQPATPSRCDASDWRNDEPLGSAGDCKLRRGVCAPAEARPSARPQVRLRR